MVFHCYNTCLNLTATLLEPMTSFAKWLSVRLRTKWMWVPVQLQSLKLQILRLFRARSCWHSGNYRVRIHSETRTWHDKNIQSNCLNLFNIFLLFLWRDNYFFNISWIFISFHNFIGNFISYKFTCCFSSFVEYFFGSDF